MPIPPTLKSIVDHLVHGTRAGRVKWGPGPGSNQFVASVDDYAIVIESTDVPKRPDIFSVARLAPEVVPAIRFRILGADGEKIDSFVVTRGSDDFNDLNRVWDEARVMARGIKRDIDKLEEKLRAIVQ